MLRVPLTKETGKRNQSESYLGHKGDQRKSRKAKDRKSLSQLQRDCKEKDRFFKNHNAKRKLQEGEKDTEIVPRSRGEL